MTKFVTLFFFQFSRFKKSTFFFMFKQRKKSQFFIFKQRKKSQFFIRRKFFLKMIDFDVDVMRFCRNCFVVKISCRINNNSKKCVKCVRLSKICDLIFLNIACWKRLKTQRKKLKTNLKKTFVKQQRLFRQLNFVEKKQQTIIENE